MITRKCEYAEKGDYHRTLDKKWRYYPVYVAKMERIRNFMAAFPKHKKILDIGCGEGVLVEEFRKQGYNIIGMDANYAAEYVIQGDITKIAFASHAFDLVLCLDVLEHLDISKHEIAIEEIYRILKPGGRLVITLPNLAHFLSRLSFLISGKLVRTSDVKRHPGDRPVIEFIQVINKYFVITQRKGFFPTFPLISLLTYLVPQKVVLLHSIANRLLAVPGWCFLNYFECTKK